MFVVASRTDLSSSKLNVSVPGIPPNDYTVIVYDLTRNGLPPVLSGDINYPAEEENITVNVNLKILKAEGWCSRSQESLSTCLPVQAITMQAR